MLAVTFKKKCRLNNSSTELESANPPQVDSQGALDQQKKKWLKSIEEESQKSLTSLDNKLNCTRELKASVWPYLY